MDLLENIELSLRRSEADCRVRKFCRCWGEVTLIRDDNRLHRIQRTSLRRVEVFQCGFDRSASAGVASWMLRVIRHANPHTAHARLSLDGAQRAVRSVPAFHAEYQAIGRLSGGLHGGRAVDDDFFDVVLGVGGEVAVLGLYRALQLGESLGEPTDDLSASFLLLELLHLAADVDQHVEQTELLVVELLLPRCEVVFDFSDDRRADLRQRIAPCQLLFTRSLRTYRVSGESELPRRVSFGFALGNQRPEQLVSEQNAPRTEQKKVVLQCLGGVVSKSLDELWEIEAERFGRELTERFGDEMHRGGIGHRRRRLHSIGGVASHGIEELCVREEQRMNDGKGRKRPVEQPGLGSVGSVHNLKV